MTENTEKTVLMKCENCGYTEDVPEADLLTLRRLPPHDDEDHLLCPLCLSDMYRIDSPRFTNK